MDFNDTPEEAQFRKEAFDWLKDNAPLKEGPKDSWRASSEEEGLKEVKVWQNKLRDGVAFKGGSFHVKFESVMAH